MGFSLDSLSGPEKQVRKTLNPQKLGGVSSNRGLGMVITDVVTIVDDAMNTASTILLHRMLSSHPYAENARAQYGRYPGPLARPIAEDNGAKVTGISPKESTA